MATFQQRPDIIEAPQDQTFFLGGLARTTTINGMVATSLGLSVEYGNGAVFTSYVTDHLKEGKPSEPCVILKTFFHEYGHDLLTLAKAQIGGDETLYTTYGLDAAGHDKKGAKTVMAANPDVCQDVLNFSKESAAAIAENLDLSKTGKNSGEIKTSLTTITERCKKQIDDFLGIPVPSP